MVLLMLSTLSALAAAHEPRQRTYSYRPPIQTSDGWETASLEDVGMDQRWILSLMNTLERRPEHWIHSLVVAKDGKLVFEEYFAGKDIDLGQMSTRFAMSYVARTFGRDTLHSLTSASNTVTSVLLGIAIGEGLVRGTDETLPSLFPEYAQHFAPQRSRITLADMLSMTSGLTWSEAESFEDPRNDLVAMFSRDDPVGYVLAKPEAAAPGARFIFSSGTTNLLGEVIRRRSGMTLGEYAAKRLFAPLGIERYQWHPFPYAPEMMVASSALYLRPRDMAKIGQLYLNGGVWNGTRVVAEEWVERSTRQAVLLPPEAAMPDVRTGSGFQWWLGTFPAGRTRTFYAAGQGGQFMFVLPDRQMVVVITAGGWDSLTESSGPMIQIVNDFVLPAAGAR